MTPLICAVQYGCLDMVQILCNFGARTGSATYKTGETALHYAVKVPNIYILICLLNYDSSQMFVDATDAKGLKITFIKT